MTAAYAPAIDSRQIRRPPWIVMVDAALPVVLVFWILVDRTAAAIASLARPEFASSIAARLH